LLVSWEPVIAKKSWHQRFCYCGTWTGADSSQAHFSAPLRQIPLPVEPGTNAAGLRFHSMGPREEDNGMLLLVVVSLICATLVGVFEVGKTRPAAAARPAVVAGDQPSRVILPFTPNTTPSER
jgi:hypothetical protein